MDQQAAAGRKQASSRPQIQRVGWRGQLLAHGLPRTLGSSRGQRQVTRVPVTGHSQRPKEALAAQRLCPRGHQVSPAVAASPKDPQPLKAGAAAGARHPRVVGGRRPLAGTAAGRHDGAVRPVHLAAAAAGGLAAAEAALAQGLQVAAGPLSGTDVAHVAAAPARLCWALGWRGGLGMVGTQKGISSSRVLGTGSPEVKRSVLGMLGRLQATAPQAGGGWIITHLALSAAEQLWTLQQGQTQGLQQGALVE
jgi:hypothetical protein